MLAKLRSQATMPLLETIPLDALAWIERYFRVPETPDHRLILAPYQQLALTEALSKDENGLYNYSVIVWSDVKKSIKSTIAAAVALWVAWSTEWGQVLVIANDLKQADTRVGYYIRRAIELNPELKSVCQIRNYKITLPNHATIEAIPIDPTGEAGSNADMVVFSELWGAHQEAQKRMWTESTLPPAKFGRSFRWIETYAGFEGESELLEGLYDAAVKRGERLDPDIEMYRSQSGNIFALWNTRPRLSWQSDDYYASEAEILPPHEFNRVHRNQWATSENAFITEAEWDACYDPALRLLAYEPMYLALDAGIVDDDFALTGSTVRRNTVQAQLSHLWEPPLGGKIDFEDVEQFLRQLRRRYNIVEIAYDPYQLHDMATRLGKEFGKIFFEFSQGSERMLADRQFYNLIRERRFAHSGDPQLRQHVLNANAKTTGEYDKLRLVKRSEKMKIDLAVSQSMSAWRALLHGNAAMSAESSGKRVSIEEAGRRIPAPMGVSPLGTSAREIERGIQRELVGRTGTTRQTGAASPYVVAKRPSRRGI